MTATRQLHKVLKVIADVFPCRRMIRADTQISCGVLRNNVCVVALQYCSLSFRQVPGRYNISSINRCRRPNILYFVPHIVCQPIEFIFVSYSLEWFCTKTRNYYICLYSIILCEAKTNKSRPVESSLCIAFYVQQTLWNNWCQKFDFNKFRIEFFNDSCNALQRGERRRHEFANPLNTNYVKIYKSEGWKL